MEQKAWLYALAASALVAAAIHRSDEAEAAPQKTKKSVECFGINTCQGTNSCGVTKEQLAAAKLVFRNHYEPTKLSECAGTAEGPASKGHLAWIKRDNKQDCFAENGFIYVKDKDGKLKIEDKTGPRE